MSALKYLNKYFIRYKWHLLLGIVFIVVTNIFNAYTPLILRNAINALELEMASPDAFTDSWLTDIILPLALLAGLTYLLVYLIKGVFLFFTRMTIIVMSRHIEYDLKNEIYNQYQNLDLAFYKRNKTGDLMNRISEDVSKVRMYLGPAVMYTINLSVLFIICISVMLSISPKLTLYSLAPLPVMSVLIYFVSSIMNKKAERKARQQSKLSSIVQETFSGIRVLKAYNRVAYATSDFDKETEEYRTRVMDEVKVNALFFPIIILLIGLSTALTIYLGSTEYMNAQAGVPGAENISKADILTFVIYINMLTWPFASVGWVTSLVQQAAASQTRINEFLKTPPEIVDAGENTTPIEGTIEFDKVKFVYPDTGIEALKDLSFKVEKGKTLAIIGRTGSGKTTITQLVARMFDPNEGSVKVDGKDIQDYPLNHLRAAIATVPQEVFLFSDSIAHNIAFGDTESVADRATIEKAAKDADIYDNIVDFKKGFDTIVGERGVTLSGGQKQRVSIARALLSAPKILIFDDCLSAVDTETEETILQNLRTIMQDKTTILISHRVSTVTHADHILVLDDGHIAEEGTHASLLEHSGIYAELHQKQLLEDAQINPPEE